MPGALPKDEVHALWLRVDDGLPAQGDPRTATRYKTVLALLRRQQTDGELATATRWGLPHVRQVRRWYQEYEGSRRVPGARAAPASRVPQELRDQAQAWYEQLRDHQVPTPGDLWVEDLQAEAGRPRSNHRSLQWAMSNGKVRLTVPVIDESPWLEPARTLFVAHHCWPAYREVQLQGGAFLESSAEFLLEVKREACDVAAGLRLALSTDTSGHTLGLFPWFYQSVYKDALWMAQTPWLNFEDYTVSNNPAGHGYFLHWGDPAIALVRSQRAVQSIQDAHISLRARVKQHRRVEGIQRQYREVVVATTAAAKAFWELAHLPLSSGEASP